MYKIAICDDDKNYREKIEKVIETEGILPKSEIRFYEYESGKELLENADILHDLVFMDMRMPGLDGNKSVLKLREYNRAAILVFCSGYFEPTPDSINIGQPFRYIMKDLHDRSLKREIPAILSKVKLHCGDYSVTVTSAGWRCPSRPASCRTRARVPCRPCRPACASSAGCRSRCRGWARPSYKFRGRSWANPAGRRCWGRR